MRSIYAVSLILAVLSAMAIACVPTPTAGVSPVVLVNQGTVTPTRVLTPIPSTPIAPAASPCVIPVEGGSCHFVNANPQVDVTIQIPPQVSKTKLTITGFLPESNSLNLLPDPTNKKPNITRNIIVLRVVGEKGEIDHFDPAMTMSILYTADDAKSEKPIILYHHDGTRWVRTPILADGRKVTLTITGLIGSLTFGDDDAIGRD